MRWWILAGLAGGLCLAGTGAVLWLRWYLSRMVDRRIEAYQSDLLEKHCAEVQNIYREMRGWRHDYHNHIQTMKAHLQLCQYQELSQYLGRLDEDLTAVDTVFKTGNVMVDAILNSKISLARSRSITVNAKAMVPEKLAVSEVDLCVVLGNLLDNAMEACMKIEDPEGRFIRVYVGMMKKELYISVTNAVGGEVRKQGLAYLTTKGGSHGFGLKRVDRIVERCGGYLNRQNEEGVFATEVMLPA